MGSDVIIHGHRRKIYALLAATLLLAEVGNNRVSEAQANDSRTQGQGQSWSSGPRVIQGRITGIVSPFVTVKTPDGFPGGPGIHPQFVVAGPSFKVDVSHARVLSADGKQVDPRPLAVGDRVLMVLPGGGAESPAPNGPGNVSPTYSASTIERIACSDKAITH